MMNEDDIRKIVKGMSDSSYDLGVLRGEADNAMKILALIDRSADTTMIRIILEARLREIMQEIGKQANEKIEK